MSSDRSSGGDPLEARDFLPPPTNQSLVNRSTRQDTSFDLGWSLSVRAERRLAVIAVPFSLYRVDESIPRRSFLCACVCCGMWLKYRGVAVQENSFLIGQF